jgi:apolipoprotein N-acyltransferase
LIVCVVTEARAPVARAFALGLLTGFVYFCGSVYWVVAVMNTYGGLSMPVAVLVGFLLASYLALYPALFAVLLRRAVLHLGVRGLWLAPALWVATEWVRSNLGGGFPWVLLGYSQASALPVVQLASVTGVYGLSFLVASVGTAAAILALGRTRTAWFGAAVTAGAVILVTGWGAWRLGQTDLTAGSPRVRVGLVQGSVAQDEKYDPARRDEIINRHLNLSRQAIGEGAQLVIWPEASTPFYFDLDPLLAAPIRRLAQETGTPFIIGTDQFERTSGEPDRYYNAAVAVGADGRTRSSYRKMHLVPFGEYVPLKPLLFFVGPLIEAVSDFSAGGEAVVFDLDGRRLSVAICYESVYPYIAQTFVERGAELLATITNDAWFGQSSAAYQHFEQGAVRGVEQGRYVVRAANTGISGAVDPYGRVVARTPLFEPTVVVVDVGLVGQRTIYSRTGDVVAWAGLAVALAVVVLMRGPGRRPAGEYVS